MYRTVCNGLFNTIVKSSRRNFLYYLLRNRRLVLFPKRKVNHAKDASSVWRPSKKEYRALENHSYVNDIDHIDDIWPYLKKYYGEIKALDAPHSLHAESYSYQELADQISKAASSFSFLGVQEGDVVALFSENSPRWLIVDQGLMRLGAANAVRGASAPIQELRYILDHSASVGLIVQSVELWEKLALNEDQKKKLKFVLALEGEVSAPILGWESFQSKAQSNQFDNGFEQVRISKKSKTSIATILYTSGTTGRPKGVPLTHANLLHQIKSLACVANPVPGTPLLSILPIWHSYERSAEYYFFSCGCTQYYTTIKFLKDDLKNVKPVVMATVPRLWESIKIGFDEAIKKMPKRRQLLLKIALKNSGCYKLALRRLRGLLITKVTVIQRFIASVEIIFRWPLHITSSFLLWPKVLRQLCGGRLLFPINGGGAIAPHVDQFFESLGIELLVGYGLTETSPVLSCRRPWRNIRGSSGTPLPDTKFKIVNLDNGKTMNYGEQGLVLVKGPQVMSGYLEDIEATKKVLDSNGWFNTGDLGFLLPDGSLVLTGRAKDTIVLSNGENIEPGPLEEVLLASPLIEQVMLVGQDKKQLGALIVPNSEHMILWARAKGILLTNDLGGSPGNNELRSFLKREINEILQSRPLSRAEEKVAGVALVDKFSIENGLLTQTLKQKREKITQRDLACISSIYDS